MPNKKQKNSVVYFTAASENLASKEEINDSGGNRVDVEREISSVTENLQGPKEIRANSLGQERILADLGADLGNSRANLTLSEVNLVDSGANLMDSETTLANSGANLLDSVAGSAEGLKDARREGDVANVGDVRHDVANADVRKSDVANVKDRKAAMAVLVKKLRLRERRVLKLLLEGH